MTLGLKGSLKKQLRQCHSGAGSIPSTFGRVSAEALFSGGAIPVTITPGGYTVTLDVVADWTRLKTADRDFVIELIDKMRGYKMPNLADEAAS